MQWPERKQLQSYLNLVYPHCFSSSFVFALSKIVAPHARALRETPFGDIEELAGYSMMEVCNEHYAAQTKVRGLKLVLLILSLGQFSRP